MDKKREVTKKKRFLWGFILLILFNVLAVAVFSIYFLNLRYNIFFKIDASRYNKPSIHYFKDKNVSLEKVLVRVFLFEPNDIKAVGVRDWKKDFKTVFNKIKVAHKEQFFNLSNLEYVIYPEVIQGKFSSQYYDRTPLKFNLGEDEEQLNLIIDEINERIKSGELDEINFEEYNYTYLSNQVFYTGSNSFYDKGGTVAGYTNENRNKNSSLLFWEVLNKHHISIQSSIVYHEILHTLGVPEGYTYEGFKPFSDDIMGMGVISNRPIEVNFLSHEFKKEMGL